MKRGWFGVGAVRINSTPSCGFVWICAICVGLTFHYIIRIERCWIMRMWEAMACLSIMPSGCNEFAMRWMCAKATKPIKPISVANYKLVALNKDLCAIEKPSLAHTHTHLLIHTQNEKKSNGKLHTKIVTCTHNFHTKGSDYKKKRTENRCI